MPVVSVPRATEFAWIVVKPALSIAMSPVTATATAVPELAILLDYTEITFYGCESSFEEDTHAYTHQLTDKWLVVECDGKSFNTRPDFFAQAEYLATMIRAFPKFFKERSGGFLSAMVNTMEWEFTHATRALYDTLTFN